MSILIVGPGAVGLTLAARWKGAGKDVYILGRNAAEERKISRGFTFVGLDGRPRKIKGLRPARGARHGSMLAAFFCTKSRDLTKAGIASMPWISSATAIVGLQNGVGHEKSLRARFGNSKTVIGSCYFAADRPEPDLITNSWGNKVRLAADDRNFEAATLAQKLLLEGGWDAALKDDEQRLLWTKLIFNAATNPLGALCGVTNGRLAEDEALKEIMLQALKEAEAVAVSKGHVPLYADMDDLVVKACQAAPRQRNSMLQDLAAGRPTELDVIAGPIIAGGKAPTVAALARWVRALERGR
jgi:2-dehydropantoate 2-reductase